MEEWVEKIRHVQGGIAFSQTKGEVQPFATTWMELEGIVLHEVRQTERDKYCMVSLIRGL